MKPHLLFKRFLAPAFLRYLLVGGFGFALDAGGTEILYHLDLDVHAARALSMTGAIGCTYLFHRYYTFTDSRRPQRASSQFLAFGAVQLTAAALNYAIFCVALWAQPFFLPAPLPAPWQDIFNVFAIGAGVGAGLVFNFLMLRLLVFQEAQPHERSAPAKENPADRRARARRAIIQIAIWAIFAAAMLLPAQARQAEVLSFPALHAPLRPADPDVWVRLTSVRQWMRGDFFDHGIRHTNAPDDGISTPWTRPLDMVLRGFYFFTPVTLPIEVRLMLAATWFPPLLAMAALAFMAAGARKMFRHTHVLACAALLWLANADVYDYFSAGDSDHHGLLSTLWCGVLMLLMSRAMSIGAAVLAGNLLGLMIWISPEALVVTALVFALLGGAALLKPEKIILLAAAATGAAAVATLGLFIEVPAAEALTRKTYDTLSIVQVALLWLTVFGTTGLAALFQLRPGFAARFCAAAVAGSLVLLCMYGLYPRFFVGPMADVDPFALTGFLPQVAEATPLFKGLPQDIARQLMEPLLAAVLLGLCLSRRKLRADRRRRLVLLALLLGGTFVWTMFQVRWDYYFQPVAIIAAAALLPGVAGAARARLCRPLRMAPRGWRPYICLWALVIAVSAFLRACPVKAAGSGACLAQMRYVIETQQLRPLLPGWDTILYVPADVGGDVLFFTPYRIIASNYHREGAGLRDLKRLETAPSPAAGRAVLKERQVDAMLFCPARYPGKSWLHQLGDGKKYPSWMTPVPGMRFMEMPGPTPVLVRVKE